jgi:hypothetical protein
VYPGFRFCGVCGTALAAAAPYPPYGVLPPRRKNNPALLVVVVVILIVVVPIAASAILYVMVSGLLQPPVQNSRPVLSLILSNSSSTQATVLVAGSQPPLAPGDLRVNVGVGGNYGSAVILPSASGVPVDIQVSGYASPFTVRWVDPGGDGVVNGGDQFVLGYPSVLPSGTPLTFLVLWYDGGSLATVFWST